MSERRMSDREIDKHRAEVKAEAAVAKADRKKLDESRDRALDRADRREWAHKRRGDERRWRE